MNVNIFAYLLLMVQQQSMREIKLYLFCNALRYSSSKVRHLGEECFVDGTRDYGVLHQLIQPVFPLRTYASDFAIENNTVICGDIILVLTLFLQLVQSWVPHKVS